MTSISVEREGPNIKDLIYEINLIYSSSTVKIQYKNVNAKKLKK